MKVRHYWLPILILLVGFAITFLLVDYSRQRDLSRAMQSVALDTELYSDYLTAETERSLTLLGTLKSFFSVSEVDHKTFDRVGADALEDYRQLHSIFWVPRVSDSTRADYERVAQTIYPGYEFKMRNEAGILITASDNDYYYPIYYQRSRGSNFGLGLDLSGGLLGKELDLIRDKGPGNFSVDMKPSFGQPIYDEESIHYLMVMLPVYSGNPINVEAYRKSFKGFLIGAIRIDSLINNFLSYERYEHVEIMASDITSPDRTVYVALHEPRSGGELLDDFLYQSEVNIVGGRRWLIEGAPTEDYLALVSSGEWKYIAWIGIVISFSIAAYIYSLRARADHVEEEVKARTRELSFANRKLERLSRTDSLTQLANRRYFDEYLEKEWYRARRENSLLSLVLCDVDYFKKYNDTYGHIEGDRCLQRIALSLKSCFSRSGDVVARYGGEEFAVILPGTTVSEDGLLARASHMLAELKIEHKASQVSPFVTMSFGACIVYPSDTLDVVDIIKSADQALYRAKMEGRSRGVVFDFSKSSITDTAADKSS